MNPDPLLVALDQILATGATLPADPIHRATLERFGVQFPADAATIPVRTVVAAGVLNAVLDDEINVLEELVELLRIGLVERLRADLQALVPDPSLSQVMDGVTA